MYVQNTDWPIVLDACYFNIPAATCAAFPSKVNITNILFKNIYGSSSGKRDPYVGSLVCSPAAVCENIKLEDIDLVKPNGEKGLIICDGIAGGIGVDCVPRNATA